MVANSMKETNANESGALDPGDSIWTAENMFQSLPVSTVKKKLALSSMVLRRLRPG